MMAVAVVTGANHGIGAATAVALAAADVDVLVTYLRLDDPVDPGLPAAYAVDRAAAAGFDVHLVKPVDIAALLATLDRVTAPARPALPTARTASPTRP